MDWRLKALAFRLLDVPGGDQIHYLLQRHVTRNWPRRAATLDALGKIARRVIDDCETRAGLFPQTVLEIGAGRDLAVPLALRGLGVRQIIASDVTRLAKIDLIQHASNHLIASNIQSWDDLRAFGIDYRAPHCVSPDDQSVDCSCSNEVLEHVPPEQLVKLLSGLRAVTTGITTHSIDYSDHYARSDVSISRLNFLRYSDLAWRPFNSGYHYVNRLRHSDYLKLFRNAGFVILEETATLAEPPIGFRVAPQFEKYEASDLFAIKGRIVAQ